MENMEKEQIQILIINKKINLINKKYKYVLKLKETGNDIFKYDLITTTKDDNYINSKSFENTRDLYFYLQGIMRILEIHL